MLHRWASDIVYEFERPHGRPAGRISHVVFTSKAGRRGRARSAGDRCHRRRRHLRAWPASRSTRSRSIPGSGSACPASATSMRAPSSRDGFFFRTVRQGQALMPWGAAERISRRIDATNPDDLTFAEVECRRMVMDEVDRLRAQVPGFEDAYLTDVALTLGITESRRLRGAHMLAREEVDSVFPDTDRQHRPLDEVRRRLPHSVPQPAAAFAPRTCSRPGAASASTIACITRRKRSRRASRRAKPPGLPRCTRCARHRTCSASMSRRCNRR